MGMTILVLHANFEGIQTLNTRCVTFGQYIMVFSLEKSRKCIQYQRSMKLDIDACHDDSNVWKFFWFI